VVADEGLLAEIAGLVEWPVVLMGAIEARFLALPPEVLQVAMKVHQKFLSVRNPATGRIEGYVVVANRETADGGATILGQRAGAGGTAVGCGVLLGERPRGAARRDGGRSSTR
jgi:glycyl-tRNA synthetase beta chain